MRRPGFRTLLGTLLVCSAVVSGCSDFLTGPDPYGARGGKKLQSATDIESSTTTSTSDTTVTSVEPVYVDDGSLTVSVALRKTPLEVDEVVTAVIGKDGGILRLREAGLMLWIPFNALKEDTEITLTAPAGDLVGYDFQPHGLVFAKPVEVVQNFGRLTIAKDYTAFGAYHLGPLEPTVEALELFEVAQENNDQGSFAIEHFSGYVIATGRGGYVTATGRGSKEFE